MGATWCPRCGGELVAPGPYDSDWRCARHGRVLPLSVFQHIDRPAVLHVRERAEVPLWYPDPMPVGWALSGLAAVGDDRSRLRATVAAYRGPAPLGGTGEWLMVAEEPGIGLGAGYARTDQATTPETSGTAPAKIHAGGHPTPLWPVTDTGPDRSVYLGEAAGVWFWLVAFPSDAGYALMDDLVVTDLRRRDVPTVEVTTASHRLRPSA